MPCASKHISAGEVALPVKPPLRARVYDLYKSAGEVALRNEHLNDFSSLMIRSKEGYVYRKKHEGWITRRSGYTRT